MVKKLVLEKISTLMTGAFGLVAALAWNDTIKAIFQKYYGQPNELVPMLTYALIVTVLAVLVTIWIGKAIATVDATTDHLGEKFKSTIHR